jgi:hypothetical protein
MENKNQNKLWFKAKRYGYGWYPSTWEGWAVLGLFILSVILHSYNALSIAKSAKDIVLGINAPILIDTVFLIIICWAKGEKAEWRWGKRK